MNILFIHQNFPGQYKFLSPALAARGHRVEAMGISERPDMGSVKYHRYQTAKKNTPNIHPWVLDFETKVIRGEYCIRAASQLADSGFTPDVICAHPGWGESLFLKELWPQAKQLHYVEYFYNAEGQDMGFDSQFPTPGLGQKCRLWTKNANNLMNLVQMDQGVSPTAWQHASIPAAFKEKIAVIHDGIDTRILNASDDAVLKATDDQGRDIFTPPKLSVDTNGRHKPRSTFGCRGRLLQFLVCSDFLDQPVKVAFKQAVLNDAVFFELGFGVGLGNFSGDFACILQDVAVSGFDEVTLTTELASTFTVTIAGADPSDG